MLNAIGLIAAVFLQAPGPVDPRPAEDDFAGPVRFEFELLPALTQAGCNSGACHGSPNGRGGFSLSLFAYDPAADYTTLVTGALGRRLDLIDPAASLLLRKPTGQLAHGGGVRLREGEVGLGIMERWIAEGARGPAGDGVVLERLEIEPSGPVTLTFPDATQLLSARAHLSDETVLEVTPTVSWFSTNEAVATVDARGLVTGKGRGQCAIVARYLDRLVSVPFVFVQPVEGYAWTAPEERGFVDRLVNQRLRDLQYLPAATCDDATFLRRVTLDLTGLVPEPDVARAFLEDTSSTKRADIIEQLLASDEHAAFWANKTADLLRVTRRTLEAEAEPFAAWIERSWRSNEPYDDFVRKLLTADGAGAGYYRALKDATTRTEATTQVFLGSRLECAKCHNHPYEGWTQDDYYRIATSFSRGVEHPRTGGPIEPWAGAAEAPLRARRAAFANWLTREDERFFARVEVNRIWAALMGRGIVEPVDDFRSSNPPSNPDLLDALAADFVASGFDRRHVLRTIANSQTYQRSSSPTGNDEPDIELFSRQRRRLLDAEQISDAVTRVALDGERRELAAAARAARDLAQERSAELEPRFGTWVDETRGALEAAGSVAFGPWSATTTFTGDDAFERDFGPEQSAAAPRSADPDAWEAHPEWKDGAVQRLSMPARSALYLTRTVTATGPARLSLSLGSDDGLRLWVRGEEVLTRRVSRGVAPDQDGVGVDLPAGESHVLLKIWNSGGAAGFYFRAGESVDERLITLLSAARDSGLDADEERELRQRFLRSDADWSALDLEAQRLERRLDRWFATQRLVPDMPAEDPGAAKSERSRGAFLSAFGQPPRATSCSCERSNEPTLAQALQMLNGEYVAERVTDAARRFRSAQDGIDELYLAVLSRLPRDAERRTLQVHLEGGSLSSFEDAVWALFNTQEFLFQH